MIVLHVQGPSHLSGLMSGSLTVTHKGHTDVHAHATGLAMRLAVKEPGMFSGKGCKHEVRLPSTSQATCTVYRFPTPAQGAPVCPSSMQSLAMELHRHSFRIS